MGCAAVSQSFQSLGPQCAMEFASNCCLRLWCAMSRPRTHGSVEMLGQKSCRTQGSPNFLNFRPQKSPPFLNAKSPSKFEENHKSFLESRSSSEIQGREKKPIPSPTPHAYCATRRLQSGALFLYTPCPLKRGESSLSDRFGGLIFCVPYEHPCRCFLRSEQMLSSLPKDQRKPTSWLAGRPDGHTLV